MINRLNRTKPFKERLLEIRRRMRGDMIAMAGRTLGTPSGRVGSSISEQSYDSPWDPVVSEEESTIRLISSDERLLWRIEQALERIEEGRFGVCQNCGQPIPRARLRAIPYLSRCIGCAQADAPR